MQQPTSSTAGAHIRVRLLRTGFTLDVDLRLPGRGITVLFGPSGSGKTTLLRCVAGLERAPDAPDAHVSLGGVLWQNAASGVFVPTWKRALGYVFQEASLLEHLNVRQNLVLGLRGGRAATAARAGLDEAVALLGIGGLLDRQAHTLSGGERQRVAIGRALMNEPPLILVDEPTSALDTKLGNQVMELIVGEVKRRSTAAVIVTHDLRMTHYADRAVEITDGVLDGVPAA